MMQHDDESQQTRSIVNRLQRIEGQVRGLQRMLEQGRDGAEILTQVSAVMSATRRVAGAITDLHMRRYLQEQEDPGNAEATVKLEALIDAFSRLD